MLLTRSDGDDVAVSQEETGCQTSGPTVNGEANGHVTAASSTDELSDDGKTQVTTCVDRIKLGHRYYEVW